MAAPAPFRLFSCHKELDPNRLGLLRDHRELVGDYEALRHAINEDGYLFLPGFLDREEVIGARLNVLKSLRKENLLDPDHDWKQGIVRGDAGGAFRADLAFRNKVIEGLIYSDRMMEFYAGLFGEPARHYDYTWMRTVPPGKYTEPHYDIVYMGRGTHRLYTAWVPLTDITYDVGGLIVLENSHRLDELKSTYGTMDIDVVCSNREDRRLVNERGYHGYGALSDDPASLAEKYNLRWLTSEYRMGDLLTFSMFTLHASSDNHSNQIRLSTDSRYQPASEPADERWIGENPIAHGGKATKKVIC